MRVTRPFGARLPEYILFLSSHGAFDGSDIVSIELILLFFVESRRRCQILEVVGLIPLGFSENPRLFLQTLVQTSQSLFQGEMSVY